MYGKGHQEHVAAEFIPFHQESNVARKYYPIDFLLLCWPELCWMAISAIIIIL